MIIAVDMDEVVNDLMSKYCMLLFRRTGHLYVEENFIEYDVRKTLPEELHKIGIDLFKDKELWDMVSPIPDAQYYIKRLIDDGHKVYFATASEPCTMEWKQRWLEKHFPFFDYKDMIMIHNKWLLNTDILVDDYYHNLLGGEYEGILVDKPWNHHVVDNDVRRASTWKGIYEHICSIYNERVQLFCGDIVCTGCFESNCKYLDDDDGGAICRRRYSDL